MRRSFKGKISTILFGYNENPCKDDKTEKVLLQDILQ